MPGKKHSLFEKKVHIAAQILFKLLNTDANILPYLFDVMAVKTQGKYDLKFFEGILLEMLAKTPTEAALEKLLCNIEKKLIRAGLVYLYEYPFSMYRKSQYFVFSLPGGVKKVINLTQLILLGYQKGDAELKFDNLMSSLGRRIGSETRSRFHQLPDYPFHISLERLSRWRNQLSQIRLAGVEFNRINQGINPFLSDYKHPARTYEAKLQDSLEVLLIKTCANSFQANSLSIEELSNFLDVLVHVVMLYKYSKESDTPSDLHVFISSSQKMKVTSRLASIGIKPFWLSIDVPFTAFEIPWFLITQLKHKMNPQSVAVKSIECVEEKAHFDTSSNSSNKARLKNYSTQGLNSGLFFIQKESKREESEFVRYETDSVSSFDDQVKRRHHTVFTSGFGTYFSHTEASASHSNSSSDWEVNEEGSEALVDKIDAMGYFK